MFDGTNTSDVVQAVINVASVNNPPDALDCTVNLLEDSSAMLFTLQASDIETPNAILATITALPEIAHGVVTDTLGVPISVNQIVVAPRTLNFKPTPLWHGVTYVKFSVNDGLANSTGLTATATVVLNVTHVNHTPTTTNSLPTAARTVALSIVINAYDVDIGDNLTVTITAYSSAGGSFSVASSKRAAFPTAPFNLPVLTVPVSTLVTSTLTYTAPLLATGNNYASLSYYVGDQGGLRSNTTTVSINIANNNPPSGAGAHCHCNSGCR